jgi:hypothetical protein
MAEIDRTQKLFDPSKENLVSSPFNSILDPRNKTDRYSHEENYVWTTTTYYFGTLHKLYGRCTILSVQFRSESYYLLFLRINVVASTVPPISKYKIFLSRVQNGA